MIDPATGNASTSDSKGGPMDARTQRTLIRLLALFLAAGAGDALVQFFVSGTYDWRHLVGALGVAAVMGLEKYLSESSDAIAAPTVRAVSTALVDQATLAGTFPAAVAPPTQPTPKPFDTLPPAP